MTGYVSCFDILSLTPSFIYKHSKIVFQTTTMLIEVPTTTGKAFVNPEYVLYITPPIFDTPPLKNITTGEYEKRPKSTFAVGATTQSEPEVFYSHLSADELATLLQSK